MIAAVTVVIKDRVVDLTALVALKLDINALLTLNGTIISIQACANLIVAVLVVRLSYFNCWGSYNNLRSRFRTSS